MADRLIAFKVKSPCVIATKDRRSVGDILEKRTPGSEDLVITREISPAVFVKELDNETAITFFNMGGMNYYKYFYSYQRGVMRDKGQ